MLAQRCRARSEAWPQNACRRPAARQVTVNPRALAVFRLHDCTPASQTGGDVDLRLASLDQPVYRVALGQSAFMDAEEREPCPPVPGDSRAALPLLLIDDPPGLVEVVQE